MPVLAHHRMSRPRSIEAGFTLIELLAVIAIVGLLSSLLLPALSRTKHRAMSLQCLNNNRQLALATLLYADDFVGHLPYNVGGAGTGRGVGARNNLNWADGILDWELTSDNTNVTLLTRTGLGPYVGGDAQLYRCPSDKVLSLLQRRAGWTGGRARSYAMNAMMGNAGEASVSGMNINNPGYRQFFRLADIPSPMRMFVMVDEHPDSINDGYFLNRGDRREWIDLPASYHGGVGVFSFADGHAEAHRWSVAGTVRPAQPDGAELPLPLARGESADWRWVLDRMSVADYGTGSDSYNRGSTTGYP